MYPRFDCPYITSLHSIYNQTCKICMYPHTERYIVCHKYNNSRTITISQRKVSKYHLAFNTASETPVYSSHIAND